MKLSELLAEAGNLKTGPVTMADMEGPAVIEILDGAKATAKKTGAAMVKLTAKSIEGTAKGRRIYDYVVFSDNPDSMPFLLEKLGCLGLLNEELLAQDDLDALARSAKGKKCRVILEGNEFNGRISPKVKTWVEPYVEGEADADAWGGGSEWGSAEEPF